MRYQLFTKQFPKTTVESEQLPLRVTQLTESQEGVIVGGAMRTDSQVLSRLQEEFATELVASGVIRGTLILT